MTNHVLSVAANSQLSEMSGGSMHSQDARRIDQAIGQRYGLPLMDMTMQYAPASGVAGMSQHAWIESRLALATRDVVADHEADQMLAMTAESVSEVPPAAHEVIAPLSDEEQLEALAVAWIEPLNVEIDVTVQSELPERSRGNSHSFVLARAVISVRSTVFECRPHESR